MNNTGESSFARLEEAMRALANPGPGAVESAIALLRSAAADGEGAAMAKLAHLLAAGVLQKADWDASLDLLQRAAEAGFAPAAAELALLAPGRTGPPGELRAAIDIRALIAPRRTEIVSDSPRLRVSPGFMTPAECEWLIAASRPRLTQATVYDDVRGGERVASARTNSAANFGMGDVDTALVFLHARISSTIGLASACFEPTSVLHYAPGQEFAPHFDFLDPDVKGHADEIVLRGQRVATFLVYLNDGYEGGETEFPDLSYRFRGRTGDALAFANIDPSFALDRRTRHAGLPPRTGEKWILSQWVRNRARTG